MQLARGWSYLPGENPLKWSHAAGGRHFIDDHGDSIVTFAAGLGVGKSTSVASSAVEGVVSSVHHAKDLLGVSGCASAQLANTTAGGCAFRGSDGNWYSSWSVGRGIGRVGASIDASVMASVRAPGPISGAVRRSLRRRAKCSFKSRKRLQACWRGSK